MKAKIIILILCLATLSAMGQVPIKRQKPNPTPQPVTPKVTPKPKPKPVTPKQPSEAAGYDVSFSCNASSTTMYIDGNNYGSASGTKYMKTGYHTIKVTADGYEDYTTSINVSRSNKDFYFSMTKKTEDAATLYSKGEEYYNKKDYAQAVKYYRQAAEMGYAKAQRSLGWCYQHGEGVTQDYNEAMKWYRKAADLGYAIAQSDVGFFYDNGYGVTKDHYEAVKWYRKAAEQGNAQAQANLGVSYENGYGVTKDYYEAVKWYRKAAEQGNAGGQNGLGYCYINGYGVTKNRDEAIKYYRMAAKQGYTIAQNNLRKLGITSW